MGMGRIALFKFQYNQSIRMLRVAGGQGRRWGEKLRISRTNLESQTKIKYNWDYLN